MKTIHKIHELRKSLHLRSSEPRRAYDNRLRRPRQILKIVEDRKSSLSILYEARRGYIVALACAFEIFWREMIRYSIDGTRIDQTKLKGLESVKMSLGEIAEVFHHQMTLGELVSCSFSFQGVAHVSRAVSALLGIDAFTELRSYEFQFYTPDPETKEMVKMKPMCLGTEALKRSNFIDKCFEIRHDTVHNTGSRFRVKRALIARIEDAMWLFNLTFGIFTEKKFEALVKEK